MNAEQIVRQIAAIYNCFYVADMNDFELAIADVLIANGYLKEEDGRYVYG